MRGDRLAIQAELIDVGSVAELWGEQYDRKMTDVLTVQEEITRAISTRLREKLTAEAQSR